jgi:hypothetical protein
MERYDEDVVCQECGHECKLIPDPTSYKEVWTCQNKACGRQQRLFLTFRLDDATICANCHHSYHFHMSDDEFSSACFRNVSYTGRHPMPCGCSGFRPSPPKPTLEQRVEVIEKRLGIR